MLAYANAPINIAGTLTGEANMCGEATCASHTNMWWDSRFHEYPATCLRPHVCMTIPPHVCFTTCLLHRMFASPDDYLHAYPLGA